MTKENWQELGPLTTGLTGASLQSIADKIILQNRGVSKITNSQVKKALEDLQKQTSIQKYQKRENKDLKNLKGLGLKKWWMDEITNRMANVPTGGWNTFYAHEPLGIGINKLLLKVKTYQNGIKMSRTKITATLPLINQKSLCYNKVEGL